MIEVIKAGRWTTVQDRGRPGFERFGIPPGGAADWFAAAAANRLVGNHSDAALLECTATGPSLRLQAGGLVAVTGGDCTGIAIWRAQQMSAGSSLEVGKIGPGLRAYVAIRGGIDGPIVLGSRSFCQRGAFGGVFGRPLADGDRLGVAGMAVGEPGSRPWPATHRPPIRGPWEIRAIAGPHTTAFQGDTLQRLTATACRATPDIDRMGMRLQTPGLRLTSEEILTTAVTAGAIQVTPSGGLIVLLVDHQTTGGYPVIATVIAADLPLLAQARPDDTIRFRAVGMGEARRARDRLQQWLADD